jgi:hypothetical protein
MLISKNYYFEGISKLNNSQTYLQSYLTSKKFSDEAIIAIHKNNAIPVIEFYSMLSKKLHKIVKEVLDNKPRPISECIKTATSIITQATITLEKQFTPDMVKESNEFISCVGLETLSEALYTFFKTGNSEPLQSEISRVREDVLFIKKYNL